MSCNSCAKSYSFLRPEKGCPGCGFSYCGKCLSNSCFVPKLQQKAKVCMKCKITLDKPDNGVAEHPVPNPVAQSVVQPTDDFAVINNRLEVVESGNSNGKSSTADKDQDIRDRLNKLREARAEQTTSSVPPVSVEEMARRLAKLKGEQYMEQEKQKPYLPKADLRSEEEKTADLLRQYMDETNIDKSNEEGFNRSIQNIESRLKNIRGSGGTTQESPLGDELGEVDKIVKKYTSLASIGGDLSEDEGESTKELPWCEICNEDASLRCLGCKYLFCKECFNEHKDDEDGCDKAVAYNGSM